MWHVDLGDKWIGRCRLFTARVIADHALCGSHLKGKKAVPMTVPTRLSTIYLAAFFGGTTSHIAFPCCLLSILTDSRREILQNPASFLAKLQVQSIVFGTAKPKTSLGSKRFLRELPLFSCRSRGLPLTFQGGKLTQVNLPSHNVRCCQLVLPTKLDHHHRQVVLATACPVRRRNKIKLPTLPKDLQKNLEE